MSDLIFRAVPRWKRAATATVAVVLTAAASGCAVGPDFARPAAPTTDRFTPDVLPANTASADVPSGGEVQRLLVGRDIPGEWWTLFHSKPLDELIATALHDNPSLEAAKATLRQARENLYAGETSLFPTLTGNVSATREKFSTSSIGFPGQEALFSLSTASLNVSYPLDIFGGIRRQIESLAAEADYQEFEAEAAYVSLTANVVLTAIQEASLRAQIRAEKEIIDADAHQAEVLHQQFALGGVPGAAVLAQDAILAQARATLPPLEKALAQARNQLAVLTGKLPSEAAGATFELADLELPQDLPVSLPSKLVEQRPDIRAAESTLHAASAEIGVATANMLPQVNLTGSFGSTASPAGNLFGANTGVWSIGGSLAQTLFDSGALIHKWRAAVAAFDQAAAAYKSTVLASFQDVANVLRALQSDADAVNADLQAERAAAKSLDVARGQYQIGSITYVALLEAEQTYQQARISLVLAKANRYSDTVALFQALGGGWWNRDDLAGDEK
ncbi:MAG TPA: efflux transporter outer membrane subunit [Alphaproteobacteria bacterium]|nr:efflux transporter outer membrane subunit [Alphaproteobacteria bacterium]